MAIKVDRNPDMAVATLKAATDIPDLESLEDIDLLKVDATDEVLRFDRRYAIPGLRYLQIESCNQPIVEMFSAQTLESLKWLVVACSEDTFLGMQLIGPLDHLEKLYIRYQQLHEKELAWLFELKGLLMLAITDSPINDEALAQLACKDNLRSLDLVRSCVTLNSRALLGCVFPAVRTLDVSQSDIGSDSIEVIRRVFPLLERLQVTQSKLTEDDVRTIAHWPGLRVLDTGTPEVDFDNHGETFWDY